MSKVGIYVVLRLWLLLFGPGAGESAQFGGDWLLYGGMMTVAFGMFGILAAQETERLTGSAVLVSSGPLLAAIGFVQVGVTAGALTYPVIPPLALTALILSHHLAD